MADDGDLRRGDHSSVDSRAAMMRSARSRTRSTNSGGTSFRSVIMLAEIAWRSAGLICSSCSVVHTFGPTFARSTRANSVGSQSVGPWVLPNPFPFDDPQATSHVGCADGVDQSADDLVESSRLAVADHAVRRCQRCSWAGIGPGWRSRGRLMHRRVETPSDQRATRSGRTVREVNRGGDHASVTYGSGWWCVDRSCDQGDARCSRPRSLCWCSSVGQSRRRSRVRCPRVLRSPVHRPRCTRRR